MPYSRFFQKNEKPSADGRPSADTAARRWRRPDAQSERAQWPPSAAGGTPGPRRGTRGDRTPMVFFPLLTPQTFLWPRRPSVARLNARGHRCVWCSKGTCLIEAEPFAAQIQHPAPDGRALLCAAKHARKIQGITFYIMYNAPDARNRAPRNSRLAANALLSGLKEGEGSQEGTGNHTWCPVPSCSCR